MTEQEVYERVARTIDCAHLGGGHPSNWEQPGYRPDIFKAFVAGRKFPIYGDNVRDRLRDRWSGADDEKSKTKMLHEVCDAWQQWEFAVVNYPDFAETTE